MHNLLNSKKAQFFVLSAFAIIVTIFSLSQWIEPYTITDTSYIVMREEFFIFNNIVEKVKETVNLSKNCEELEFNLEEYKTFVEDYASTKTLSLDLSYVILNCDSSAAQVFFNITLTSPVSQIKKSFVSTKLF
ncbi:MAG: hypothetical protein QXR09_01675 [Candidatus Aenigmatarchaeota archaeon]